MASAFLKSRINGQVIIEYGVDHTAHKLRKLGATVSGEDSDQLTFVIDDRHYLISGQLERWEGTNTRIRYKGEIKFEPFDSALRSRISIVVTLIAIILSVVVGVPLSIAIFGANGIYTYYNTHFAIAFLIGGAIVTPILIFLNRDPQAQQRWYAQQKLGKKIEKIKDID